ncbi:hypothetical protein [Pectobacterium colocasium]|uniref:hypothetical protein n=1 Tax=Pectobacterium colocasium TaxID=2878098 RepID=UPI001CD26D6B|nr:hypothetical protein [Pectobacterium colocasium]
MHKLKLAIPMVLILTGCGDEPENSVKSEPEKAPAPTFSITTDAPDINRLLPAIRHLLPGLDKYSEQFQEKTIEHNRFLTIKFHIPDNANIPAEYVATGHNCFIEINDDRTGIKIPKSACQATLFDRQDVLPNSDYWVYFYPDDLTYTPHDFANMSNEERIKTAKNYLNTVAKTIESVQQKDSWIGYDFPNYGRQFKYIAYEGRRFLTQDVIQPYSSCTMVGFRADNWWGEQISFAHDPASNDPQKMASAMQRIKTAYNDYKISAAECSKDIKSVPEKPKPTEILPPTPDNKPPRPGCLMVFKADNTTEWSCPVKQ